MKYLFAAGSRSGSEFSISLTSALLGDEPEPIGKVHSARESQGDFDPPYSHYRSTGRIADFVTDNGLSALKLEDPGVDDDADRLFAAFPGAVVIATFRPLDRIINSHGNIRPWGMAPDRVAANWAANLAFYERARAADRLVMIPLEDRDAFDSARAARLLKVTPGEGWQAFHDDWPVVNDLVTQKKVSRDTSAISFQMERAEVLAAYPETDRNEQRYRELI